MKRFALISLAALFIPACAHHQAPSAPQASKNLPVICRLVARDQTITISASGHGPVYSVQDAKGQMLLSYASRDQLRLLHPDLSHQLDSYIASREMSDRARALDMPAASIDRVSVPSLFSDGPIMLKMSE